MSDSLRKFGKLFLIVALFLVFPVWTTSCSQEDCDCSCDDGDTDESEATDEESDEIDVWEESDSTSEENPDESTFQWQAGMFVFTEIMFDPASISDSDGEWVEVLNASEQSLSFDGCSFSDGNESHETEITYDGVIEPGERLIFGIDRKTTYLQDVDPDWHWGDFNLGNEDDGVRLVCDGLLIDEVYYSLDGFPFTLTEGSSFSLCAEYENSEDNDDLRHWYASEKQMDNLDYGSPREAGKSCETE